MYEPECVVHSETTSTGNAPDDTIPQEIDCHAIDDTDFDIYYHKILY